MDCQFFSSKDVSHHDEGTGAAHEESSSVSIGDLWPKIDNLDEAGHEVPSRPPHRVIGRIQLRNLDRASVVHEKE
jgi:hypothetical protein